MRLTHFLLFAILSGGTLSCKKDKADLAGELKGSVWAGEFQYTSGGNTLKLQPYSIVFGADDTFMWYDITGDYPGTWKTEGDNLTITFGSGSIVTATLSGNVWGNITNLTSHNWRIVNIIRSSAMAIDELQGTMWKGFFDNGASLNMNFVNANTISLNTLTINYTKKGACFRGEDVSADLVFGFLAADKSLKGIYKNIPPSLIPKYFTWQVQKQ